MANSFHRVFVVPFNMEPIPGADALSIVKFNNTQCVVNTQQWLEMGPPKVAAHIQPDSLVPVANPLFTFLAKEDNGEGYARVKAVKLRGMWSYGMLAPIDQSYNVGDDVTEVLGVKHYEPPEERELNLGQTCKSPELISCPGKYDLESLQKYWRCIEHGEMVTVQEKVDGSNLLAVYWKGEYRVKSRSNWKLEYPDINHLTVDYFLKLGKTQEEADALAFNARKNQKQCSFWKGLRQNEPLMKFLRDNEGVFAFGELFGNTNRIKYKLPEGNRVTVFDFWKDGQFFNPSWTMEQCANHNIEHVPIITEKMPFNHFDIDALLAIAEGKTAVVGAKEGTIREGIVVKTLVERWDEKAGRLALKKHSPSFGAI